MFATIGRTVWAFARNWTMVIAIIVSAGLATYYASERSWLIFAALSAIVTGIGANFFVMVINGGRMPVCTDDESWLEDTSDHQLMHEGTRYAFLGDWINVSRWLMSPGDICLYAGILTFIIGRWFLS